MLPFGCCIVGIKLTSRPDELLFVRGEIPLLSVPPIDKKPHRFQEKGVQTLDQKTPVVVLDDTGDLYFGAANAFSTEYQNVRNKFVVRANHGSPQTGQYSCTSILALSAKGGRRRVGTAGHIVTGKQIGRAHV